MLFVALAFVLAACGSSGDQNDLSGPGATAAITEDAASTGPAVTVTQEPSATDAISTAGVMDTPTAATRKTTGGGVEATVGASAATLGAGGTPSGNGTPGPSPFQGEGSCDEKHRRG